MKHASHLNENPKQPEKNSTPKSSSNSKINQDQIPSFQPSSNFNLNFNLNSNKITHNSSNQNMNETVAITKKPIDYKNYRVVLQKCHNNG